MKQNKNEEDEELRRKLEQIIGEKTPILQVASFYEGKNQLTTLKAFKELTREKPNTKLIFVSGITNEDYLAKAKQYIEKNHLNDKVEFLGKINHDKIRTVYEIIAKKKGIKILPSHYEVLPLVMLEAMAYGLPVITTNRNGMKDVISNEKNGYLINNPDDHKQIKTIIKELINNEKTYKQISNNARETIKDYSLEKHVMKHLAVYAVKLGLNIRQTPEGLPYIKGILGEEEHIKPGNH